MGKARGFESTSYDARWPNHVTWFGGSLTTGRTLTMTDSDEASATTNPEDRSDLLAKARSFLASPQVRNEDVKAKRAFLVEKGLNDTEIVELLRTIVCVYALVLLPITFLFFQVA